MSINFLQYPTRIQIQIGTDLYSDYYEVGSVPTPPTEDEIIINPTNAFLVVNPTNDRIEVHV